MRRRKNRGYCPLGPNSQPQKMKQANNHGKQKVAGGRAVFKTAAIRSRRSFRLRRINNIVVVTRWRRGLCCINPARSARTCLIMPAGTGLVCLRQIAERDSRSVFFRGSAGRARQAQPVSQARLRQRGLGILESDTWTPHTHC